MVGSGIKRRKKEWWRSRVGVINFNIFYDFNNFLFLLEILNFFSFRSSCVVLLLLLCLYCDNRVMTARRSAQKNTRNFHAAAAATSEMKRNRENVRQVYRSCYSFIHLHIVVVVGCCCVSTKCAHPIPQQYSSELRMVYMLCVLWLIKNIK